MLSLVISKHGEDLVIEPFSGISISVGRHFSNDVSLPDPSISRRHCELRLRRASAKGEAETISVVDRSGRGLTLGGRIVESGKIRLGESFDCGAYTLRCIRVDDELLSMPTSVMEVHASTRDLPKGGSKSTSSGLALVCELSGKMRRLDLEGEVINIGSGQGNNLVLSDDFVSGFHARLIKRGGEWFVRDLESKNGVVLDGVKVVEARLGLESVLKLGETVIRVVSVDGSAMGEAVSEKGPPVLRGPHTTRVGVSARHGIVTADPVMEALIAKIESVAPTGEPVLITGESGTGKELVARAIHSLSGRSGKPLYTVNCSAFTPNLIESELFGHEKGAFTGSDTARQGLFEEADGGTLFLDEIGDMSLDLQPRLLRAIEYGEVKRVGSNKAKTVDVRIISATNQELEELVSEKSFRGDLFYRLKGLAVRLPSLRQRAGDIPLLANYFLERMTNLTKPKTISEAAMEVLDGYSYPGNVRELQQIIRNAAILAEGCEIGPDDIELPKGPDDIELPKGQDGDEQGGVEFEGEVEGEDEGEALTRRADIIQALRDNGWNKSKAAEALGIARTTLRRRMALYGIDQT